MKAAYADPPYLGCAAKHYGDKHPYAGIYDSIEGHEKLINELERNFDSWALSAHEPSLRQILPLCPNNIRIAVWVKPFAAFKKNVTRAYTWEPVIFKFCRAIPTTSATWRDHLSEPITMKKGFPGAKPKAFAFWIFEGLGLTADDDFVDLYPGSGAFSFAWEEYKKIESCFQLEMPNA